MTIPRVTKFSTHEIFHPRIFSRLLRIGLRESRYLKPRKLILKTRDSFSRKFAPPKLPAIRYVNLCYCLFPILSSTLHTLRTLSNRLLLSTPNLAPLLVSLEEEEEEEEEGEAEGEEEEEEEEE